MTELQLNQINSKLYDDAKIYWVSNKNYSSKLFERMINAGYEMRKSGAVSYMIDKEGKTIASGFTRVDFLQRLAYMME